jgi:hypothetical protein
MAIQFCAELGKMWRTCGPALATVVRMATPSYAPRPARSPRPARPVWALASVIVALVVLFLLAAFGLHALPLPAIFQGGR